ncbi:MAG: gliding motility-associated C-terminal domain-containing protein [Lewinellaceae bacterium]|nr:gliding motility-associated C-terminal domain-containing protein [Lewinellaceae bacterium]
MQNQVLAFKAAGMYAHILALFILFQLEAAAQNLVPNPSFEILEACPTDAGQTALAEPWEGPETPDLFNACATSVSYSVPTNLSCNYLPAHEGEGYVGMFVYFEREAIFARLLDTLESGRQYFARFYVAADDDCSYLAQTFSDAIGMGVKGTGPNDNFRIVAENQGAVIRDTAGWTKVSGCFQAQGNELIVQVGNFRGNDETILESTDTIFPISQQSNYLFVDDLLLAPFNLFPDTVLMCNGEPVKLDATFYEADIKWLTGDTTPVFLAQDTGVYFVEAKIDGCVFQEKVTVVALNFNNLLPPDTSLCQGDEIVLSPNIEGAYLWSNGSKSKTLRVSQPGIYDAAISNICGDFAFRQMVEWEACKCRVFVPNVFSPNGDGINDALGPYIGCDYDYEILKFEIYSRWGERVWSSGTAVDRWDGLINGREAVPDTYVWYVEYDLFYAGTKRRILEEGGFSLIR